MVVHRMDPVFEEVLRVKGVEEAAAFYRRLPGEGQHGPPVLGDAVEQGRVQLHGTGTSAGGLRGFPPEY